MDVSVEGSRAFEAVKGYERSLVAWAEHHDLVRDHIHPRDLEYERIVDVLDDAVSATANT